MRKHLSSSLLALAGLAMVAGNGLAVGEPRPQFKLNTHYPDPVLPELDAKTPERNGHKVYKYDFSMERSGLLIRREISISAGSQKAAYKKYVKMDYEISKCIFHIPLEDFKGLLDKGFIISKLPLNSVTPLK